MIKFLTTTLPWTLSWKDHIGLKSSPHNGLDKAKGAPQRMANFGQVFSHLAPIKKCHKYGEMEKQILLQILILENVFLMFNEFHTKKYITVQI